MSYIKNNFLLTNKTAEKLYFDYAKNMQIFDYHCHLSEYQILENKQFNDIFEIWLAGDHYKWRLMRNYGIDEEFITGNASNKEIFDKSVSLINNFKDYFIRHNQVIYENPSPGNKAGGITTLEEKSLGCVQKGGLSPVVDVLDYGDVLTKNGLSLLNGPGNDIVAVTNLMACGVHMILFTTGRGTPLGSPVPTVKIATNNNLAIKKSNWIDFDASPILEGVSMDSITNSLLNYVIEVASGKKTKNEENGFEEISIFKDGVTL